MTSTTGIIVPRCEVRKGDVLLFGAVVHDLEYNTDRTRMRLVLRAGIHETRTAWGSPEAPVQLRSRGPEGDAHE
jgi:hypothetical protein